MSEEKFVFMTEQKYQALLDIIKQYYIKYCVLEGYIEINEIEIDKYKLAEWETMLSSSLENQWEEMLG